MKWIWGRKTPKKTPQAPREQEEPQPSRPAEKPEEERIHYISGEFVEEESSFSGYNGTNDYHNQGLDIETIIDRDGKHVNPVWEDDWTMVSPGIETRSDNHCRVRVHRSACPVRIRFADWYEYVAYDEGYGNTSWRNHYWVRYEAEKKE